MVSHKVYDMNWNSTLHFQPHNNIIITMSRQWENVLKSRFYQSKNVKQNWAGLGQVYDSL